MDEHLSISDIKLKLMLQEASDKLHELDATAPKSTPYIPSLSPAGSPSPTLMNDAFRKFTHQERINNVYRDTDKTFQDFQSKENPDKLKEYKDLYEDWRKSPEKYRTPDNERDQRATQPETEIHKTSTMTIGRKYSYSENQRMLDYNRPANKFTEAYNSSLGFGGGGSGRGMNDPSKDEGPTEPGNG